MYHHTLWHILTSPFYTLHTDEPKSSMHTSRRPHSPCALTCHCWNGTRDAVRWLSFWCFHSALMQRVTACSKVTEANKVSKHPLIPAHVVETLWFTVYIQANVQTTDVCDYITYVIPWAFGIRTVNCKFSHLPRFAFLHYIAKINCQQWWVLASLQ